MFSQTELAGPGPSLAWEGIISMQLMWHHQPNCIITSSLRWGNGEMGNEHYGRHPTGQSRGTKWDQHFKAKSLHSNKDHLCSDLFSYCLQGESEAQKAESCCLIRAAAVSQCLRALPSQGCTPTGGDGVGTAWLG